MRCTRVKGTSEVWRPHQECRWGTDCGIWEGPQGQRGQDTAMDPVECLDPSGMRGKVGAASLGAVSWCVTLLSSSG